MIISHHNERDSAGFKQLPHPFEHLAHIEKIFCEQGRKILSTKACTSTLVQHFDIINQCTNIWRQKRAIL
ncbi:hypothetical protein WS65_31350 [Burkholderia anthina]|nr:hypothetical protein WS65_31350 [Burkholderia anthina]